MATIAPLTAQQIADLFGAVNELVGTGDNSNASFQLDFFPIVGGKDVQDELVGLGDGATTIYNLRFSPVNSGSVELRVGTITGTLLADPADYSIDLVTGQITLTGSGVTALGTEQLRAKYSSPSSLFLQVGPILSSDRVIVGQQLTATGTLLAEGVDYSVDIRTGAITLTPAGVTALGLNDLHALYEIPTGFVNVLKRSNGGHRQSISQGQVNKVLIDEKDAALKEVHEAIEKNTLVDTGASAGLLEAERSNLLTPHTVIFGATSSNELAAGEAIDETKIFDSVDQLFKIGVVTDSLYPLPSLSIPGPSVGNPRWPDGGEPRYAEGLSGGTGTNLTNEENQLNLESAAIASTIAAYPIPPDTEADRRTDSATTGFPPAVIAAVTAQIAALTNATPPPDKQIEALTNFLAANPTPNEYVSAGDIANATTALANANTALTDAQTFLASLAADPGWSDAALATRQAQITARLAYITGTRLGELQTLLTTLYNKRFFWITQRIRVGDGTLFQSVGITKSATKATGQITNNDLRIDEVLVILQAQ